MKREKLILVLAVAVLAFIYVGGLKKMFFHQDDIDFLIAVSSNWPKTIFLPVNEHVVVIFWLLYRMEWWFFGVNFAGFLTVSFFLHILNLVLAGRIVFEETKSRFYGLLTLLILTVNNNWNESVWWSTGQMWLMATLFCLVSLWLFRRKKLWPLVPVVAVLPGLSWGVGLIWPSILVLAFRIKGRLRWGLLISQTLLIVAYRLLTPSKAITTLFDLTRLIQMAVFVIVGLANTVVGRLVFPWENKPVRFLVLVSLLFIVLVTFKFWRKKFFGLPQSLALSAVLIYLTYSLGRADFGIGQAMATRYAYLPTFFLVMAAIIVWSRAKINGQKNLLILTAGIYLSLSGLLVFDWRVTSWVKRPQEVKNYFNLIKRLSRESCLINETLPGFINPDPTKRLSDLKAPLRLDWQSGTEKQDCVLVSRSEEFLGKTDQL